MPKYSAKNVNITFDGGLVVTGLAEDTFVETERNTQKREFKVGAKGTAVIVESADDTGTATITLDQTSPTNNEFRRLYNSGEAFDLNVADNNPNSADSGGSECYIANTPGKSNGSSSGDNEWEILVVDYTEE